MFKMKHKGRNLQTKCEIRGYGRAMLLRQKRGIQSPTHTGKQKIPCINHKQHLRRDLDKRMTYDYDSGEYSCPACQMGGNDITLVMRLMHLDEATAIRWLGLEDEEDWDSPSVSGRHMEKMAKRDEKGSKIRYTLNK